MLGVAAAVDLRRQAAAAQLMPDGASPPTEALEHWFGANGWRAFDFQREVWAAYLNGESGLIHSATGTRQDARGVAGAAGGVDGRKFGAHP